MDVHQFVFGCVSYRYFSYLTGFSKLFGLADTVQLSSLSVRIAKQLGTGGSGDVYLAHDIDGPKLQPESQRYALKKVVCSCREHEEQVRQEIGILQKGLHSCIVKLADSAVREEPTQQGGVTVAYLLLPLYTEGSLWDLVHARMREHQPLSSADMLHILSQVTDALTAMHEDGWIHRDVKPQNILVETVGTHVADAGAPAHLRDDYENAAYRCAITDLGSCCSLESVKVDTMPEAMRLTAEAENACSPLYRPPELYDVPHKAQLDGRIDVWALGCLLYFMMMGVNPFELQCAQGANLVLSVHRAKVTWDNPPRKLNPGLQELVHACLRPDFRDRPTSEELGNRITHLLKDMQSTPRSPNYRPQPFDQTG